MTVTATHKILRPILRIRPDSPRTKHLAWRVAVRLRIGLLLELKERQVPLELNPTSNVRTGISPSFEGLLLRCYFDAGLLVTLNSGDPVFFGANVANEYLYLFAHQL